jgi:hypothetical protein
MSHWSIRPDGLRARAFGTPRNDERKQFAVPHSKFVEQPDVPLCSRACRRAVSPRVIARSVSDEAIQSICFLKSLDCFASLAMTDEIARVLQTGFFVANQPEPSMEQRFAFDQIADVYQTSRRGCPDALIDVVGSRP